MLSGQSDCRNGQSDRPIGQSGWRSGQSQRRNGQRDSLGGERGCEEAVGGRSSCFRQDRSGRKRKEISEVGQKVGWQGPAFVPIEARPHNAPLRFRSDSKKSI